MAEGGEGGEPESLAGKNQGDKGRENMDPRSQYGFSVPVGSKVPDAGEFPRFAFGAGVIP
jgi:hypothetical protein